MLSSMNIGGVEKSLISLLSVIPKEKYDVTILLLEKKGAFLEFLPSWVKVKEATWYPKIKPAIMQPPKQTVRDYFKKNQYLKMASFIFYYVLAKLLNDRNTFYKNIFKSIPNDFSTYDIAISYQAPTDIIDFYIANKVRASKKIAWVHFDVTNHLINEKFYNKLYKKLNKIFVVSKEAKKQLIEKVPITRNKSDVFLNIVSPLLITELSKKQVNFDDGFKGIRIVTVGRLSIEKGQDIAIKALSKLIRDGYSVRWYCVGEGSERKEYENLIEQYQLNNDFKLLGATTNPYPYIARSDIYVQPSRHEGFCLTLAEAKCLHKPIVTTNFVGAYEQLTNEHNGLIVGCNEGELYKKIKELIDNPDKRNKLAKNLLNTNVDTTKEVTKLLSYI